jgi:peptidoglycan/xylan/chitin deacetylase (PgdA/CDA1 family)
LLLLKNKIRNELRKLKFLAGLDPKIESKRKWRDFIPHPYKSVLLISADFELAWAWQFTKSSSAPLQKAMSMARRERENIPKIVDVCEQFNIPVTWATVGHLFLEKCINTQGMPHKDIPRLAHFENKFWKFNAKDWFVNDPCTDYLTNPEWYCPDLIKMILNSSVNHEIGNHTFSHIDCRNGVCPPEVLRAELAESKKIAAEWGLELKSFVHPGHTIGNLDVLAVEGFTNFRTDYRNVLGYPKKHTNGIWELEQTMEFRYYDYWSVDYQIKRYITIIERAIKSNTVCVFWFHPSFDPIMIEKIWPEVFRYIDENRDKIWLTAHSEYINWLNSNEK